MKPQIRDIAREMGLSLESVEGHDAHRPSQLLDRKVFREVVTQQRDRRVPQHE